MKPFTKSRIVREGKRDGKLGLPLLDDEFPGEIERLKDAGRKAMGKVVEKWSKADTQLAQSLESARTARETAEAEATRVAEEVRVAADEDAARRGPEQDLLDAFQADADDLTRRLDAGELLHPITPAKAPEATQPPARRRRLQRDPQDREAAKAEARKELKRAAGKLESEDPPEGIPFWGYVVVLVVLGLAELPLNLLGFRILRERDELTYLLVLVPTIVLIGGAHVIALLEERGSTVRALLVLFSVLFVIYALFNLRIEYINSQLASYATTSPSAGAIVNPEASPTTPGIEEGTPSPGQSPESVTNGSNPSGFGNTGWGFFGLNYGAFVVALALAFVYHGSRQHLTRRIDVAQAKLDRLARQEMDEAEDQLDEDEEREKRNREAAAEQGQQTAKLTRAEERQRRREFAREISNIYNSKMRPIQEKRRLREERLEQLKRDREAATQQLRSALDDERQRGAESRGAASEARRRVMVVRDEWNGLLGEYKRANMIGRAKKSLGGQVPRGFAAENLRLEVPEEYLAALDSKITA